MLLEVSGVTLSVKVITTMEVTGSMEDFEENVNCLYFVVAVVLRKMVTKNSCFDQHLKT